MINQNNAGKCDAIHGNYSKEQEAIWEREKFEGLIRAIVEQPAFGRDFIKKMGMKKGHEYEKTLMAAANAYRDKRIKGRQIITQQEPSRASHRDLQSLMDFNNLRKTINVE